MYTSYPIEQWFSAFLRPQPFLRRQREAWEKDSSNVPRECIQGKDHQVPHGCLPIAWLWSVESATLSSSSSRKSSWTSAPCSKKVLEVLIHYSPKTFCNPHNNGIFCNKHIAVTECIQLCGNINVCVYFILLCLHHLTSLQFLIKRAHFQKYNPSFERQDYL